MGIAENGFREITNSKHEIKSVDDMKNLKVRVAGSNLLMECYKRWGADATNMNWSETYTALQQKTVDGQENPLPAIDAASVQEVQPYCSMWDAIYDCLFFCINQDLYDTLTPEQQAVVDECGQKAVEYERYINRSGDEEIMNRWQSKNGVTITKKEDMDIDSFKKAVEGVDEWFVEHAAKQAQRKEAYELIDNTCFEMMASGDSFRQYLDVQGRFDRYSVANAILVSAQMPEATQLKEYSKWKASRVYVNKDAQKIIILEPSKEYTREDGTKGISYNAKVVYDISETSAKDRQQEQEPKSMRELVSALIDASPVPCVPVDELELPAYYDSSQQTIFVKKGLSETTRIKNRS